MKTSSNSENDSPVAIHIAVVEDQKSVAQAYAFKAKDAGFIVDIVAYSGEEFIEAIKENETTTVVLMDIALPGISGFDATAWLKKNKPSIRVIAVTAYYELEDLKELVRAGVCGIIPKTLDYEYIIEAIHTVHKSRYYMNTMYETGLEELHHVLTGKRTQLTRRQLQYIILLSEDKSDKEIAVAMNLSVHTVFKHRKKLFDRFEVHSRVGLIVHAFKKRILRIE